ncbi:unnamed protein product [Closterium sp. NIES-53]
MTTLWVLLHVAAQRDYELHSLDFSIAFLQGSLHEEICLRRPVYGLRQAPREWHDTLTTTLAALGFAPATADPSLFLRIDTSLPPFYVLVYITQDRARRTITLTQSQMVHQVLHCFGFQFSSPPPTPLSTSHSLSAPPSDESVEPSGPYPELVGCLISGVAHKGYNPIRFDTWLDDLQLYLLSDSRDSVSLFDHTSGASLAPPATANSATRSQWLTRDAAARLAIRNHMPFAECAHFGQHKTAKALYDTVVARYSSPATAAQGCLILPYLFPELFAFATVENLVTHLRTSVARYHAALLAEDHFLALDPTALTVDLLEQHLLAAETSVVAVGAASGTPCTPFVEGCSPSPLAPSYASATAVDVLGAEDDGATASRCFFRDSTTLTPLFAPVPVRLADPSGGPVLARSSTVLPCPAVPSGSLSGLHLPSFSTNLVSTTALQDVMVITTTPGGQRVLICTCTRTGRHLATFTRRPGSSLYTLATKPPHVVVSSQMSASGSVATPCSCRLLSHQNLLSHHRLGHPSLPRLRGMNSCLLVSGLPRSLPPLKPSPALPCLPCVEGRQRAAPHSSSFPQTTAPLQTLHMDVWGPAHVSGQVRERYFLLVVDDYKCYTTVFPLRSKGEVLDVLIPWIRAVRLQLRERFRHDLPFLRLHSDRGGDFSSDLLRDFCRGEGILQSFTLLASPQQNGIAERRIG